LEEGKTDVNKDKLAGNNFEDSAGIEVAFKVDSLIGFDGILVEDGVGVDELDVGCFVPVPDSADNNGGVFLPRGVITRGGGVKLTGFLGGIVVVVVVVVLIKDDLLS